MEDDTWIQNIVQRLDALRPEWVSEPGRWGVGVSWECALHGHRLVLMFKNAADGGRGTGLHLRSGTSFSTLTVVQRIDLPPCFIGWIDRGLLVAEVGPPVGPPV